MSEPRHTPLVRKLLNLCFYRPEVAGVALKDGVLYIDLSFNSFASKALGIEYRESDYELYTLESPFLNAGMLADDCLIVCLLERLTSLKCSGDNYYYEIELPEP